MILLDSHTHLDNNLSPEEIEGTLQRARSIGVRAVVNIGGGDGLDYAQHAVDVAERYDDVFATVGVHPHDARIVDDSVMRALELMCGNPKVVAVGETGLDFHYNLSEPDVQRQVFRRFIGLARSTKLPLVLHVRDAHEEVIEILQDEGADEIGGVCHCFTSGPRDAARYLELGFYVSIPGVVTFKNAEELREAVPTIPLDRLLVETDAPYLAPVPKRGKKNESAYLVYTAQKVAELRGMDVEELGAVTARNAARLYRIPESILS